MGGNPLTRTDPTGLAPFDFDAWTKSQSGQINSGTNCYGYAIDTWSHKNPGNSSVLGARTCEGLISGAKKDGSIDPGIGQCGGSCPTGYHKIQIFLDSQNMFDRDYHVYRQDDDGGWSHKQGRSGVPSRLDASGVALSCPINSNRDFGSRNYSNYCETMCVPETGFTQSLNRWLKK